MEVIQRMEPNTHKYRLKQKEPQLEKGCNPNAINVSRSIGNAGSWVGCGFIDKSGTSMDHHEIQFPFYSLVFVFQGRGEYIDEHGNAHLLESGSLFQRRPWVSHSTYIDPGQPWHEYYIDLDEGLYEQLAGMGLLEKRVPVYRIAPDPTLKEDFEALMHLLNTGGESRLPDITLRFIGVIRDLINQAHLATSEGNPDVNAMVEKSCLDFNRALAKRIDLRDYCLQNGWGYESFRKSFKKAIGISPGQYMLRRRMDEASRLLRSTTMRISEISTSLGYTTQYEFSNQFKRQFGVFPTRFRGGGERLPTEAENREV